VTYEGFKHLVIDSEGNVVLDHISESEFGEDKTVKSKADILFKALDK